MSDERQHLVVKKIIRATALLLLGCALFYLAVRNQQWETFSSILASGNYMLVPVIIIVSLASYVFRNERWRLLAHATAHQPDRMNAIAALSVSYLVNYAVPRLGELTRCYLLKRKEKIPFELTLGTVVVERLVDIVMLCLVVLVALLLQFNQLANFALHHIWSPVLQRFSSGSFAAKIIGIAIILGFVFFLLRKLAGKFSGKIELAVFTHGLKSILKVKHKGLFILYTIGIWICYFLMTYLWAFSFRATGNISFLQAFVVMTAGTLGRSLPIQGGGFGAYHFMVTQVLLIYGISEQHGFALAVVIHAGQMIFSLLMGIWGYVYINTYKH